MNHGGNGVWTIVETLTLVTWWRWWFHYESPNQLTKHSGNGGVTHVWLNSLANLLQTWNHGVPKALSMKPQWNLTTPVNPNGAVFMVAILHKCSLLKSSLSTYPFLDIYVYQIICAKRNVSPEHFTTAPPTISSLWQGIESLQIRRYAWWSAWSKKYRSSWSDYLILVPWRGTVTYDKEVPGESSQLIASVGQWPSQEMVI